MYTTINIIYGLPLVEKIAAHIIELEERDVSEEDPKNEHENWWESQDGPCGFYALYDGSAQYQPGYCGVLLKTISACGEPVKLSDFQIVAHPTQIFAAHLAINALPKWVKKMYEELNMTPDVYIVYSTS